MAGVESLHQVERLGPPDLAQDDSIGTHAKCVANELADADPVAPLGRFGSGLETDDMSVGQAQLGGVFDGDDAFAGIDQPDQRVEQGRLPGTRTAAHQDVGPAPDQPLHQRCDLRRTERRDVDISQHETANGDVGPVERDGGHHHVDAGAVRETTVDGRAPQIDPAAHRGHHALDKPIDLGRGENQIGLLEDAIALQPDRPGTVDHDLAHRLVGEQWFDRPQPSNSSQDLPNKRVMVGGLCQRRGLERQLGDVGKQIAVGQIGELEKAAVDPLDQRGRVGHSNFPSRRNGPGMRAASVPASTARATAGSHEMWHTESTPSAWATSRRPSARPGSSTRTTR